MITGGLDCPQNISSSSRPVSFPCGQQSLHMLSRGRSLLSDLTMELDDNSTDSWLPILNSTEMQDEWTTVNATSEPRGANETELMVLTRIVGGVLVRRGGSPWQVRRHLEFKETIYTYI